MLGVTKQLKFFERRFRGTRRQSPAIRHVSSGNDPGIGGTLAVFWHVQIRFQIGFIDGG